MPALALGAAALTLLTRQRVNLALWAAWIGQTALVVCGTLLWLRSGDDVLVTIVGGWLPPAGIPFVGDRLSAFLVIGTLWIFVCGLLYACLDSEPLSRSRVLGLTHLLQAGIHGALLTGDLFNFYVFFELMGLASYGLVAYRGDPSHLEAGFKYAVMSLTGSMLMLIGIGGIYAHTGVLNLAGLWEASHAVESAPLYLLSISLVLVALGLKAALMPLHFWLPDAHSIAPTPISILLSGAVVNVGAYGIMRLLSANAPWVWGSVTPWLLTFASATAILAALIAAAQRDFKRLLAYSTASQMGYALAAGALGTVYGVGAALLYLVIHAVMKAALFACAGLAIDVTSTRRWDQMGGLIDRSPLFAAATLVSALSLAGIPPLAGFVGKVAVFGSLLDAGAWLPVAALLVASLAILAAMARVWLTAFGGEAAATIESAQAIEAEGMPKAPLAIDAKKLGLVVVMAAAVVAVGIAAGPLSRVTDDAARDFLDGTSYRSAVLGGS